MSDAIEMTSEEFVGRLFDASVQTMDVFTVYLGDRLGLYRSLADEGPATAGELASRAGISERYAREWLEQQTVTGILTVDDAAAPQDERRYALPKAHVEALTDPDSPWSIAPLCRSVAVLGRTLPALLEAFRSGEGVGWDVYGRDMTEAQGDFNRPWLLGSLGTAYLPSIGDIHARLSGEGARVADVACGVGWAAISIARAYPNVRVDGYDLDEPSIELARHNAEEAGVADRIRFEARDATDPALAGNYDLAIVVEAIHDLSRPVEVLRAIRAMLKDDGTLIVADERVADTFTPGHELDRVFYGYSVLCCLPSGMVEQPSAETGTVMRKSTFERYAAEAGFDGVEVLPIEHDFLRFYRLDA